MPSRSVIPLDGKQYNDVTLGQLYDGIMGLQNSQKKFFELLGEMALVQQPNTEVKQKFVSNENQNSAILNSLYQKLNERVIDLQNEFEDEYERIFYLASIRKALNDIADAIRDDQAQKYTFRSCIMLHDAIKKTKAENINLNHLPIIIEIIEGIINENITKEKFKNFDKKLFTSGMDWVFGG